MKRRTPRIGARTSSLRRSNATPFDVARLSASLNAAVSIVDGRGGRRRGDRICDRDHGDRRSARREDNRIMRTFIVALALVTVAAPAFAQNKREMQMMADIRMLQEQNQQLQVELHAAIAALNETLKAINSRVDEQSNATRKAFADQALKLDQFASEQRVVREGVSENNVRISQLSQEVEAVRLSIPQFPAPQQPTPDPAVDPAAAAASGATPPPAPPPPQAAAVGPGMSPQRLFD